MYVYSMGVLRCLCVPLNVLWCVCSCVCVSLCVDCVCDCLACAGMTVCMSAYMHACVHTWVYNNFMVVPPPVAQHGKLRASRRFGSEMSTTSRRRNSCCLATAASRRRKTQSKQHATVLRARPWLPSLALNGSTPEATLPVGTHRLKIAAQSSAQNQNKAPSQT